MNGEAKHSRSNGLVPHINEQTVSVCMPLSLPWARYLGPGGGVHRVTAPILGVAISRNAPMAPVFNVARSHRFGSLRRFDII